MRIWTGLGLSHSANENTGLLRRFDLLVLAGAIVALFLALASGPWWTLAGTTNARLLSIQVSPYYLHVNAIGLPSTSALANGLGSLTRILIFFGFLALAAASIRPSAWWHNLAVYFGLSALAELYLSFLLMYYWTESAFVIAYGIVPPYSGTATLPGRILGLDLTYYSGPLVTAAFAIPFYLGFFSFSLVMGRGIIRFVQDRTLRVLASLLPGGGVHDVYLTPPYKHIWFSSGDKEFNPMATDPDRLNDDELLVSFQRLYDTVEPGGSLSIILPAWATGMGDRFQKLMPNTGFTIEEAGVIYRVQGKPETELRFRKPLQEAQEAQTIPSALDSIPALPLSEPSSLEEGAVETLGPPVIEISEEPAEIPTKLSRLERNILKTAMEVISQHQHPVPYRELLNQVYMNLVDKKVDFDSARQIEATLLDHNGREIILLEDLDQANDRVTRSWWLGEQRLAPERKTRVSPLRRISTSKAKFPSVRFLRRKSQKSKYVEKRTGDAD